MASSYNRKSNSSASKAPKPTFRRAGSSSARPSKAAPRPAAAPARPANVPPAKKAISAYTAPSKASKKRGSKSIAGPAGNAGAKPSPRAASRPSSARAGAAKASARSKAPMAIAKASPKRVPAKGAAPQPARQVKIPRASAPAAKKLTSVAPEPRHEAGAPKAALVDKLPKVNIASSSSKMIIGLVSIVAVLALVAVVVMNSSIFAASDVRIEGSAHVSQESAEQLIQLPQGTTLFNVNDTAISEGLMKNPWVSGVDIERQFPHTLVIKPHERSVLALVYITADDIAWAIGDDKCWIAPVSLSVTVDAEGAVVDTVPNQDDVKSADDVPAAAQDDGAGDSAGQSGQASTEGEGGADASDQAASAEPSEDGSRRVTGLEAAQALSKSLGALLFTDVSADVAPKSGKPVESDVVLAGLKYASEFTPEFFAQVKFMSIPSQEAIAANLVSGVEVALGEPEDIKTKERVVTKLLEQEQGVTYINVRTPEAYTFRNVPQ